MIPFQGVRAVALACCSNLRAITETPAKRNYWQIIIIIHCIVISSYHVPSSNDYRNWTWFGRFENMIWIHRNKVFRRCGSFDAPTRINKQKWKNSKMGMHTDEGLCALTTKFDFSLKDFPQLHWNGRTILPLWYSICRTREIFFRNDLPQPGKSHLNSCECVCVFRWSCIVRFLLNPKLQISHLNGLLSLWTVMWVDRPPFCVNDRPHSSPATNWIEWAIIMKLIHFEYTFFTLLTCKFFHWFLWWRWQFLFPFWSGNTMPLFYMCISLTSTPK